MGIRFFCPNGHKLNVKDFQAGRTGFCPLCGVKMEIPLESTRPSSKQRQLLQQGGNVAHALASKRIARRDRPLRGDPLAEAGDVVWYVHPPSGGQFGPAATDVMRVWIAEGRVGTDCLVWREGWRDWQMAGRVFPQLSPPPAAPGQQPEVLELAVAPLRSSIVPDHRRPQAKTWQIIFVGSLVLAMIVLFFILHAVL
jgi:GYF domain 2